MCCEMTHSEHNFVSLDVCATWAISWQEFAALHGATRCTLGAMLTAVQFYEKLGYKVSSGEVYLDAGIEHLDMELEL